MSLSQFVRLSVQQVIGPEYVSFINQHFIDFAIPSSNGQVGKTILTLAAEKNGHNRVATADDIDALAQKISSLTPVQVYYSGLNKETEVTGPGLVNMTRVLQITEHEKYVTLTFVDGETIRVTNRLV